jgi:hypothetical protein
MRNIFKNKYSKNNYHKKIIGREYSNTNTLATEISYINPKGEQYRINLVTKKYIDLIFWKDQNIKSPYLYFPNMVIVDEINKEKIKTIKDLIKEGRLETQGHSSLDKKLF